MTLLYFRPRTLEEAVHTLAESRGTILSGGTDFFPSLGDRAVTTPIVDISAVTELKGIHSERDTICIGGRTTWSEILDAPLPRGFDGLKAAAREVGSVQIQNVATVAGNLCNASPAADGIPALLALDARGNTGVRSRHAADATREFCSGKPPHHEALGRNSVCSDCPAPFRELCLRFPQAG